MSPHRKSIGFAGRIAFEQVTFGPGFFTVPAAKIAGDGGSVLALDINPLAVEHGRRKIQQAGVTNAAQTHFPDQSFDLIFIFGFARAVGGMAAIWPELHRLLKPGGTLSVEGTAPTARPAVRGWATPGARSSVQEAGRKIGQVSSLLLPMWPMRHPTGSAMIALGIMHSRMCGCSRSGGWSQIRT